MKKKKKKTPGCAVKSIYLFKLPAEEEGLRVSLCGAVEEERKRGALEELGGEMVPGAGFIPLPKNDK